MDAVRAPTCFDGERFLDGGATVLVDDGRILGVEAYGCDLPDGTEVQAYDGTLLPGLVDMHTHLVTDSGLNALDRVAGYTDEEIDDVVTQALHDQLAAGVTTVRDLGDRDFCVVERRDRQDGRTDEPRILAAGPPVTVAAGHCHYMGGVVAGGDGIREAVAERVRRGVDVVKVMASGGVTTPGTDVLRTQFTDAELRLLVDEAHAAGLPVTAHAHGTPAVAQALAAGVDGLEHVSCVTERGFGVADDELLTEIGRRGTVVCPTLGADESRMPGGPPAVLLAVLERFGLTMETLRAERAAFVGRLRDAGAVLVSGVDSGIQLAKAHGTLAWAVGDLVEAGCSPAEALASATSVAVDAAGLSDVTGRLRPGCEADLLVVDGDLMAGVEPLRRPVGVRRAGVLVS